MSFEAYSVSVTLKLHDLVSAPLLKLSNQFKELDVITAALNKNLRGLGSDITGLSSVTRSADKLTKHLGAANLEMKAMQKNMAGLGVINGAQAATHAARSGNHAGIHYGAAGVGMSSATLSLGSLAVPVAAAGAGAFVTHGAYESAKELQKETTKLTLLGMSAAQNKAAQAYLDGLKTVGTSQIENMHLFTEAQGIFREAGREGDAALEGAKVAMPLLADLSYIAKSLDGTSAAKLHTSSRAMLRFIEMRGGVQDPNSFNAIANAGYKAIVASGGNVDWEQYRQAMAKGGVAMQGRADNVVFGKYEPLIAELKGGAFGDGEYTSYKRLIGAVKLPGQVAKLLLDQNIWDKSKVTLNRNGGIKAIVGNPLKDFSTYVRDDLEWYEKNIIPMYAKMHASEDEQGRLDTMIFGGTGGRLYSLARRQMNKVHESETAWSMAMDIGTAREAVKKTADGAETSFVSAWTDFKAEFGKSVLPEFTKMLTSGTALLRTISSIHSENKSLFDFMGKFAGFNGPVTLMKEAREGLGLSRSPVDTAPGMNKRTSIGTIQTTVMLPDKRVLAEAVSEVQAKELNRPPTGANRFDGRMNLAPVSGR